MFVLYNSKDKKVIESYELELGINDFASLVKQLIKLYKKITKEIDISFEDLLDYAGINDDLVY